MFSKIDYTTCDSHHLVEQSTMTHYISLPIFAQHVHIPDPSLDAIIRHALDWPSNVPIPQREMLRLSTTENA